MRQSDEKVNEEIREYVQRPFGLFSDLVGMQARARPDRAALICDGSSMSYADLNNLSDRVAVGLQMDGVAAGAVVAICAASSINYVAVMLGALRTGAAVSPLSPSSTPNQLLGMLRDSGASHLFVDRTGMAALGHSFGNAQAKLVSLEGTENGPEPEGPVAAGNHKGNRHALREWLPLDDRRPKPVTISPEQPFNIIYSSGTTGTPKGIIQPHAMRWPQLHLLNPPGYGPDAVALISTPLYSNTTLVSLLPALAGGGTVVLMPRFDARAFLELSQRHRATEAMLVPVQYRRILDVPDFDAFDLSSFRMKFATSAPFSAEMKAEVLERWPGGLIEYFGMTEGGGSCMLVAHEFPNKLHTVGRPIDGHEILVIGDAGEILPYGEAGEAVGRSAVMMNGYHNQPGKTREAEWYSPEGHRYIRTGDIGRFDADGFFELIGRKKDMIISGGINIYPVDLEAVLLTHPSVREASVVGVPSARWDETPVGFVSLKTGENTSGDVIRAWANERLGRMQRLADVRVVNDLPRSVIGKILKRTLQELYAAQRAS